MLVHTVVFWLKPDLSNDEKEQFFEGVKSLGRIPSVDSFHMGTPANTPKRPVIDDSYDCCLNVILKDLDAQDEYQVDPIHTEFVEKCAHLWDKVVIYDAD